MVDKCRSGCGNIQSVLDVNREILMKTSDINNLGNAYRSIYEAKTKEEVSDNKEFVPHMMYDPETGKGYKAEKPEDHERMSKMGYTHEEPDLVKEKKLPRQMLDPKKDVMVVKNNKVLVVDKSKEKEYLKKGWGLAEQIDEAKVLDNMSQLPYPDIERPLKSMQQVKKDADLGRMEITHIVKNKQGNKVVAAVVSNGKKNFVYVNNKGVAPLAEQADDVDERMKFGKRLKVGDIVYTDDGGKYIKGEITKIIGKHDRDSGTFEVKLKSGKVVKRNLDQMAADDDIMEAVSPEQQAAIAISKKEKEEMKNEGSVKDLAMKIDKVVAKMSKNSKLKPFAKKFASMAMNTMDIEKSLEKALPDSVSGAEMISMLEKQLDPVDDKANDKKFKDRKDKDIDNDGDVDSSDEYLHNRRAKVDDEIDGGKKPAKKEEEEKKEKGTKSPKVSELEKIGEEFIAMLEAELVEKAEPEAIDDKESPKSKEFIAKHKKSDKKIEDKEEEAEEATPKAGKATKEKSGKRAIDSTVGDAKIVNPVKEEYENPLKGKGYPAQEKNEPDEVQSLVQMARAHLSGQEKDFKKKEEKKKNPYDARFKEARAFMTRMDKRRGINAQTPAPTPKQPQEEK